MRKTTQIITIIFLLLIFASCEDNSSSESSIFPFGKSITTAPSLMASIKATNTVMTKDGGKTATCSITVNPKVAEMNGGIENYGDENQDWGN